MNHLHVRYVSVKHSPQECVLLLSHLISPHSFQGVWPQTCGFRCVGFEDFYGVSFDVYEY